MIYRVSILCLDRSILSVACDVSGILSSSLFLSPTLQGPIDPIDLRCLSILVTKLYCANGVGEACGEYGVYVPPGGATNFSNEKWT